MKHLVLGLFLLVSIQFTSTPLFPEGPLLSGKPSKNVIIVSLDGFRWQELYLGADSVLLANPVATPDGVTIRSLYWDPDTETRRKKLMPFIWNLIGSQGTLFGNRRLGNKVNTANSYAISYPGYNEMLTGATDPLIATNDKVANPNINILEYLNACPAFKGRVAAITSWDVFPFILNETRNGLFINSGYADLSLESNRERVDQLNGIQQQLARPHAGTRDDLLTYVSARLYLEEKKPAIFYLGFGGTDEAAHQGRYDLYLQNAAAADRMIGELWHWLQTTPDYRDNTTLIITTDHGRGNRSRNWSGHGMFISGSSQTWVAVMGPGFTGEGECNRSQQLYQKQLAKTIAASVGENFPPGSLPQ